MQITSHLLSDVGRVRRLNEDNARIVEGSEKTKAKLGDLYILADGMGGHEAGEVASQLAVDTIAERYYQTPTAPDIALRQAIEEANRVIYHNAQEEDRHGMGTTVVAAAVVGETLYSAHVGDSRIYLIRAGDISQLTRDHSLVAEQIEAGLLSPEEAALHPHRNIISRAVGTAPHVEVDIPPEPLRLREGDIVLLCSDGLTEHVPAERIEQLVRNRTAAEAAQTLVDAANAAGGSDNISVIIVQAGPRSGSAPADTLVREPVTTPLPSTPDKPERRARPAWAILLLLVGVVGVVGGWYLFGDLFTTSEPGGNPPILGSATQTPEGTASTRPTRTPRVTTTRTPSVSPEATPPTDTLSLSTLLPSILLLDPASEAILNNSVITFSAVITNLQASDEVQLRMGLAPETMGIVPRALTPDGSEWYVALTQPPTGDYGLWYWNIVVVSTSSGSRTVYKGPERRLEWRAPSEP